MTASRVWSVAMIYYYSSLTFFAGVAVAALVFSIIRRREHDRSSQFIVDLWKEKGFGFVLSLAVAGLIGILTVTTFSDYDYKLSIAIGAVSFMLTEILVFLLWDRPKGLRKIEKKIDEQLGRLSVHCALWTDGSEFDSVMRAFHDEHLNAGAKQVIATFVARKLKDDFAKLSIVCNAEEYSELAAELIPHCRLSIYYTINLTPKSWFEHLLGNRSNLLELVRKGQPIAEAEYLSHVRALNRLPGEVKQRRLVLLPKELFERISRNEEERSFMRAFLAMNQPEDLRFAELETVYQRVRKARQLRLDTVDYGIYNGGVTLKWEGDKRALSLSLKVDAKLLEVFNFEAAGGAYKTPETIRSEMRI